MFRIAAIVFFALSVIFYAFSISHDVLGWVLWMLLGLLCWCISEASWPWVPRR